MSAARRARSRPEPVPEPGSVRDRPLHYVKRGSWPIALCGALVHESWDSNRTDTAGRDRYPACLRVLQQLREGVN